MYMKSKNFQAFWGRCLKMPDQDRVVRMIGQFEVLIGVYSLAIPPTYCNTQWQKVACLYIYDEVFRPSRLTFLKGKLFTNILHVTLSIWTWTDSLNLERLSNERSTFNVELQHTHRHGLSLLSRIASSNQVRRHPSIACPTLLMDTPSLCRGNDIADSDLHTHRYEFINSEHLGAAPPPLPLPFPPPCTYDYGQSGALRNPRRTLLTPLHLAFLVRKHGPRLLIPMT